VDATEDLEELLDESVRHALGADTGHGWSAATAVPLRFEELEPGTLGWRMGLTPPGGAAGDATIVLLLLPSILTPGTPRGIPLRGVKRSDFVHIGYLAGPPRLLLLAQATDAATRRALAPLATTVLDRLRDETTPGGPAGAPR